MIFTIKTFNQLTLPQLYEILKLRYDVFVKEQNSIYDEYDQVDYKATHIFLEKNGQIVAYLRLFEKSKGITSIGRVVVHPNFRSKGIAKKMMQTAIKYIKEHLKSTKVQLAAQEYLKKFYKSFDFKQTSKPYDDCGVTHIDMELAFS